MFQKIANALSVEVEGTDLTKATKIEFYVRQGCSFFQYEPTVVDETHLLVKIPYADAMRLQASTVRLQLALTDGDGNPMAAEIVQTDAVFTDTTYEAASATSPGLMSAADYTKLSGFSNASDYAKKTDISGLYKYKGSKATFSALPTSGNVAGDVWNVEDTGMNYAWTGTAWDALGTTFEINSITNGEIDTITADT